MPNLPARCQILNSERKSFKSFITEEREAFKVEFQISTLDACILIMVQQVILIMFLLNMLDYSMSFLSLSTILIKFYSLGFHA